MIEHLKLKQLPIVNRSCLLAWGYALLAPALMLFMVECIAWGRSAMVKDWLDNRHILFAVNYIGFFLIINSSQFLKRKNLFYALQYLLWMLVTMLAIVNKAKLTFRLEPILLSDITLLSDAIAIGKDYFPQLTWALVAYGMLMIGGLCFFMWRFQKQTRPHRPWTMQFTCMAIAAILCSMLFSSAEQPVEKWWHQQDTEMYSSAENAQSNGSLHTFVTVARSRQKEQTPPQGYSKKAIEAIASTLDSTKANPIEKDINLIIILGEAVIDPMTIPGVTLATDPIPNIRRLMQSYSSGSVVVPGFGGGTFHSESALLQGISCDPYSDMTFYGIPRYYKDKGYRVTALHSYYGWFYDRYQSTKQEGFDAFLPLATYTQEPVWMHFPIDRQLYANALNVLKTSQTPDMLYIDTMQTHGGYQGSSLYSENIVLAPNDAESMHELNNYLSQLAEADHELNVFLEALRQHGEPTAVLYFGDHWPSLPALFETLHITAGTALTQQTPYFIWTNFPLEKQEETMDISHLGAYTLARLGEAVPPYMRLSLLAASDESHASDLALLRYDILNGKGYFNDLMGYRFDNPHFTIGLPMRISSAVFVERQGTSYLEITGEHFPYTSEIRLNQKTYRPIAQSDTMLLIATDEKTIDSLLVQSVDEKGYVMQSVTFDKEFD